MKKPGLWLALAAFLAAPAQAHWHKAESDHFVIYADAGESSIGRFAEILERYDAAMRLVTGFKGEKPSPSNRVTIFVVGSERNVRKLAGDGSDYVAGFYVPRAGNSRAFVPRITSSYGEPDFSLVVLLHEYAHHFMISTSRHAMPRWMSEGAAEFFASAKFGHDGSVSIGRPAYHRMGELAYAKNVSVQELLDHKLYEKNHGKGYDAFYGRAWGLYHYLYFEKSRRGQLDTYWNAIASGTSEHDAAIKAFGDLNQLGKDLDSYLHRSRILSYKFKPEWFHIGPVTVTEVSDGMDNALPLIARSQRGVSREQALELLPEVQKVAAKYPRDPGVLSALAEAEHDAGHDDASIAAADRALAIDPKAKNALIQKGLSLFRKAESAKDKHAAFKQAMLPFSALNHLENNNPLPLIYYYRSFVEQGKNPPELARKALERASQLAPFDQPLAMNTALMDAGEGRIAVARMFLEPIAANPHGGRLAERAQAIQTALADVKEGSPWHPSPLMQTIDGIDSATAGLPDPGN